MSEQKILPFYMTYPLPVYVREEDTILKDLEYLQQLYPADAKKYQKKIVSVLNKIDYESSMIQVFRKGLTGRRQFLRRPLAGPADGSCTAWRKV